MTAQSIADPDSRQRSGARASYVAWSCSMADTYRPAQRSPSARPILEFDRANEPETVVRPHTLSCVAEPSQEVDRWV